MLFMRIRFREHFKIKFYRVLIVARSYTQNNTLTCMKGHKDMHQVFFLDVLKKALKWILSDDHPTLLSWSFFF